MPRTNQPKQTLIVTPSRVSVSRKRVVNLGRFDLPYESEEVFITISADVTYANIQALLEETESLLDEEVTKIEMAFSPKQ